MSNSVASLPPPPPATNYLISTYLPLLREFHTPTLEKGNLKERTTFFGSCASVVFFLDGSLSVTRKLQMAALSRSSWRYCVRADVRGCGSMSAHKRVCVRTLECEDGLGEWIAHAMRLKPSECSTRFGHFRQLPPLLHHSPISKILPVSRILYSAYIFSLPSPFQPSAHCRSALHAAELEKDHATRCRKSSRAQTWYISKYQLKSGGIFSLLVLLDNKYYFI